MQLILAEHVATINLIGYVTNAVSDAVGNDNIGHLFKLFQIVYYFRVEELRLCDSRLVHNDFDAFCLDTLHDALDAGVTKIV